jgi:hypothetical protein
MESSLQPPLDGPAHVRRSSPSCVRRGPLKNRKREAFARDVAALVPYEDAYRNNIASPTANPRWLKFNGAKLAQDPEVAGRIAELKEQFAIAAGISVEFVQARLLQIIDDERASCIHINAAGERAVKIDRLAAIEMLATTLGLGAKGVTVNATAIAAAAGAAQLEQPRSDLDVARRIAFLLNQAAPPEEVVGYHSNIETVPADVGRNGGNFAQTEISESNQAVTADTGSAVDPAEQARQLSLDIAPPDDGPDYVMRNGLRFAK